MSITDRNKLLAEFMGMTCHHNDKSVLIFSTENGNDILSVDDLKYHTDWNWLMQVVEKIESLGNDVFINTNYIQITFDNGEQFIKAEEVNVKIQATYNACVEFIKYYNDENN